MSKDRYIYGLPIAEALIGRAEARLAAIDAMRTVARTDIFLTQHQETIRPRISPQLQAFHHTFHAVKHQTRVWRRTVERLASLFAKELGMSKEEYLLSIPSFKLPPESVRYMFPFLGIVEKRLSIERVLQILGVELRIDPAKIRNNPANDFEEPNTPYCFWYNENSAGLFYDRSSRRVYYTPTRPYQRGETLLEGLAVGYNRLPNLPVCLPGSITDEERYITINRQSFEGPMVVSDYQVMTAMHCWRGPVGILPIQLSPLRIQKHMGSIW